MIQRFAPSSTMTSTPAGDFVSFVDYERLEKLLNATLELAGHYLQEVELGKLAAADASTALQVTVRLRR